MARLRNRTRGQVLPSDPCRPVAAQHRAGELAPADQGHRQRLAERGRGVMTWPFRRRRSADDRLDAELRDHVERQFDEYVREGLSPADARRRVGIEFGSMELAKDECRDVGPLHWLATTA